MILGIIASVAPSGGVPPGGSEIASAISSSLVFTNSLDIEFPAHGAGDLLLCFIASNTSVASITASGWQTIAASTGTGSHHILARVGAGGGGDTVTFTASTSTGFSAICYAVPGWFGSLAGVEGAVITGLAPPAVSPSWGASESLFFSGASTRQTNNVLTAPTGYEFQVDSVTTPASGSNGDCRIASARRIASASTETPSAWGSTGTVNSTKSSLVAVRQA